MTFQSGHKTSRDFWLIVQNCTYESISFHDIVPHQACRKYTSFPSIAAETPNQIGIELDRDHLARAFLSRVSYKRHEMVTDKAPMASASESPGSSGRTVFKFPNNNPVPAPDDTGSARNIPEIAADEETKVIGTELDAEPTLPIVVTAAANSADCRA